jgi:hypothetical protein
MAITRRHMLTRTAALGGAAVLGGDLTAQAARASTGDPVLDALDLAEADANANITHIRQARASYLSRATPTPVAPTPVATGTPKPAATATIAPAKPSSGIRLCVPSYWGGDNTAIDRFKAAGAPAGTILCGGAGIANDVDWRGGHREPWSAEQDRRIKVAHAGGLKILNYIGIGNIDGGVPDSTGGNWNDLGVVLGKIAYAFQLYPDLDGIFLDEFPYSGYASELAQIRDAIRSRGKAIVANAAGWQGFDTERDNASYCDVLNVFERGYDRGDGGGPYFGNADGDDGYAEPDWFHQQVPASKVSAWVYGVPDDATAIAHALDVARSQGVGNLYLTDRPESGYHWGDTPSASFMAKLFAAVR